jgi:hypothetical protein
MIGLKVIYWISNAVDEKHGVDEFMVMRRGRDLHDQSAQM